MHSKAITLTCNGQVLALPVNNIVAVHYAEVNEKHRLSIYVVGMNHPFMLDYDSVDQVNEALKEMK